MTATAPGDNDLRGGASRRSSRGGGAAGGGGEPGPEVLAEEPVVAVVRRGRTSRRRRSRVVWAQVAATVVFAALLAGLAWVGYQASRHITGGGEAAVTDPTAPGYVAEVKPTTVDLVAVTDRAGKLASALIVTAGADGKGGTVSALPPTVVAPSADGTQQVALSQLLADGGSDALRQQLGLAMTFGFTSAETVSADTVASLARLAGPITVSNVDNLVAPPEGPIAGSQDKPRVVRYPAGEMTLQPDEVTEFLAFAGADESEVNQALRHQVVWDALLTALKGKDASALQSAAPSTQPGSDPGFTSILPDLLKGDVSYEPVPLEAQTVPGTLFKVYRPDPAALPAYVARTVPFPTAAAPGQRARVRLLNGTTRKEAALLVAPKVVAAGGEISLLGNADSFDVATTEVQYVVQEAKPAAEAIAAALGVTATKASETAGSIDVNVIVGRDRSG